MSNQTTSTETKVADNSATLTLLIFKVGEQAYGLPVASVVRIIEMVTITSLPNAPETIQGIINLRGKAVPVMDLRQRFGLPMRPYGLHTPIILVDMTGNSQILGLIADTVEYVLDVSVKDLELTETIMPTELIEQMVTQAAYLAGVAQVDRRTILMLNVRALLTPVDQGQILRALSQGH